MSESYTPDSLKRPVHILVECADMLPSVSLGVLKPLSPLVDQGICQTKFKTTLKVTSADIAWCDILVCVRGFWIRSLRIAQAAKQNNRLVVYFLDDDLLNIPKDVPSGTYLQSPAIKKNIEGLIEISDAFWCVSNYLAQKYSQLINGKLIIGKVPFKIQADVPKDTAQVRILYAGSTDHQAVVQNYLLPALNKVCGDFNEHISVDIIGPKVAGNLANQITCYPYFDNYDEYRTFVGQRKYHLGLAPIFTEEFYKSKYCNKYLEYTSLGIVGVYTQTQPYTCVVKDKANGYLCLNKVENWYSAIKNATLNHAERQECAANAQSQLCSEFYPDVVATEIKKQFEEFVTYRAPEVSDVDIHRDYRFLRHYFTICRIIWMEQGVASVPFMIKKGFNKMIRTIRGQR